MRAPAFCCLLLAWATPVRAADGLSLMKESERRQRIAYEEDQVQMAVQSKGQPPQVRTVTIATLTPPPGARGDKVLIRFEAPADVRGTALLSIEQGEVEDQWLYLPAFKKTRRIGASELSDRFAGTDYFYEDLKQRELEDYSYAVLSDNAACLGGSCFHLEVKPKNPKVAAESPYARSELFLRKDIYFVVLARHFDKQNRPLKELKADKLTEVKKGVWRADELTATDVQRQSRTISSVRSRSLGEAPPPGRDPFNPNTLATP